MITPPKAQKKTKILTIHNDKRPDDYFWLNQRDSPEVLNYLEEENTYFEQITQPIKSLQETLFQEMKSRIKEDDQSVPFKENGYWYTTRYEKNKEYPIFIRYKDELSVEEILFDVNQMAQGYSYYHLTDIQISPNNQWAAFLVDDKGRREYQLQVKNLLTNEILPLKIQQVAGVCWANDNQTLFYTKKNPVTLRSEAIAKHRLGTNPKDDIIVYTENDTTFDTYVYRSKSGKYIIIGSESSTTSEFRYLDAQTPESQFSIFQPRQKGVEYSIFHYGDYFYILNNSDGAFNFKIDKTPINHTQKKYWHPLVVHSEDILLEDIDIFARYLVISQRHNGLTQIRIISWDGQQDEFIPFDSETYLVQTTTNPDFDTDTLRYQYTSLKTPASIIDYHMPSRTKKVLKEQAVLDVNFNKDNYTEKRLWATADDGTAIPISLIYHKDKINQGTNPLLLYGYGSYGITIDPSFSSSRLSLLDRGFIYAIAHIRGGEYLGRTWYENGKLLNKRNTFTDFITCAKHLINENYTSTKQLYAMGGSAGGLLIGAVMNMAGNLFNGMIAQVPFVDVITTMLDEEIPLTTGEYEEWGNPNDQKYYHYMKSYSPYDNVTHKDYPHLLVTTGYHDSQVQYWEPAKWVARLRDYKTDTNLLLFHTDMHSGHSGASGRFESLKELAREYAFLLSLEEKILY